LPKLLVNGNKNTLRWFFIAIAHSVGQQAIGRAVGDCWVRRSGPTNSPFQYGAGHAARGKSSWIAAFAAGANGAFHEQGVRGVRLAKSLGWDATFDELKAVAERIVKFDWHFSIWPSDIVELERMRKLTEATNVRVVLDHLAGHCWDAKKDLEQEGFAMVVDMLKAKQAWLKVSGMYRVSQQRSPWLEKGAQRGAEKYIYFLLAAAGAAIAFATEDDPADKIRSRRHGEGHLRSSPRPAVAGIQHRLRQGPVGRRITSCRGESRDWCWIGDLGARCCRLGRAYRTACNPAQPLGHNPVPNGTRSQSRGRSSDRLRW